jgi:hypothetical protein
MTDIVQEMRGKPKKLVNCREKKKKTTTERGLYMASGM